MDFAWGMLTGALMVIGAVALFIWGMGADKNQPTGYDKDEKGL